LSSTDHGCFFAHPELRATSRAVRMGCFQLTLRRCLLAATRSG
jgi:hypothetical protein